MRGTLRRLRPWVIGALLCACGKNDYALVTNDGGTPSGDDAGTTTTSDGGATPSPNDSGPDPIATAACDLGAPFDAPALLGPPTDYFNATLTPDELSIVMMGGGSEYDLWTATRQHRTDAFPPLAKITAITGADSSNPSLSADGKTLYFLRTIVAGDGSTSYQPFKSTRPDLGQTFTAPTTTSDYGNEPIFGVDELTNGHVYFAPYASDADEYDIEQFDPATKTAIKLAGVNTTAWDYNPAVTADELTIYFTSTRLDPEQQTNGAADIFVATRASKADDFANVTRVVELNADDSQDIVNGVSADGCRVYFTSSRNAQSDESSLYVAEKPAKK